MKKITTFVLLAIFSLVVVLSTNAQKSVEPSEISGSVVNKMADNRIDIRVNSANEVILRADCFEGQKRLNYILKVYSEGGDMVFASSFLKKGPIYKSYDLSNLPQGKYTFNVSKKLKTIYSKTFSNNGSLDMNSNNEPLLVEEI